VKLSDSIPGARKFTWAEALFLRKWAFHAYPADDVVENIIKIALVLQMIRNFYDKRIYVHSWYRPDAYNQFVHGAPFSAHRSGLAVDFHVDGYTCKDVRSYLEPRLEQFGIRMEDKTMNWVHIDARDPGPQGRLFQRGI